jgi:hypothetical protein
MTNDTANSLTDFDMCLALAQKAINSQMAAAWKTWIARSEFSTTGQMKDFALVSIYDDDSKTSGLELEFDPLTVSLYVPNGKLGQVQVTLHLKSGSVFCKKTQFDASEQEDNRDSIKELIDQAVKNGELSPPPDRKKDKTNYDLVFRRYEAKYQKDNPEKYRDTTLIANWSISFLTDLDKKPCDRHMLEEIDSSLKGVVDDVITKSGLPDSVFSIEYIFMKFTQVDLLLADNKNIQIPNDVPEAAKTKALTSLNQLLQGKNGNFMLGTVVRRSKQNSKDTILPTFALTDFIFNVKADSVPEASTLSYLGMFARRPLPTNIDTARIALQDNWVRPEMINGTQGLISGVMVISKQVFMEKYLIPAFSESLKGETLESSGLTWTFKREEQINKDSGTTPCIIPPLFYLNCSYDSARDYSLQLAIQPGTNQISICGQMDSHAIYDGRTPDYGPFGGKDLVSWIHYRGYSLISGSIMLEGEGIGTEFKFNPKLNFNISPVRVTEGEGGGLAKVTEALGSVFKTLGIIGGTPGEALAYQQQSMLDGLKNALESELNNLEMDLSQHAFIPPGGGVFTFQNPRFSYVGDLIFDVIYQAP